MHDINGAVLVPCDTHALIIEHLIDRTKGFVAVFEYPVDQVVWFEVSHDYDYPV